MVTFGMVILGEGEGEGDGLGEVGAVEAGLVGAVTDADREDGDVLLADGVAGPHPAVTAAAVITTNAPATAPKFMCGLFIDDPLCPRTGFLEAEKRVPQAVIPIGNAISPERFPGLANTGEPPRTYARPAVSLADKGPGNR
jgi:hypothetical protein